RPPRSGPGVTARVSASPMIWVPSARRASIISPVSRLRSAPVMVDGPSASAARTSALFVIDLDPGRVTVACTGASTWGAGQKLTAPPWRIGPTGVPVVLPSVSPGTTGRLFICAGLSLVAAVQQRHHLAQHLHIRLGAAV